MGFNLQLSKNRDIQSRGAPEVLEVATGDVLFSQHAVPIPETILQGFRAMPEIGLQEDPVFSFEVLGMLLEFLELVVITERLIVPVPTLTQNTITFLENPKTETEFALYHRAGDLKFSEQDIKNKLVGAGVMFFAPLSFGGSSAEEVVAKLMPSSKALQDSHSEYLNEHKRKKEGEALAAALTTYFYGVPLHISEASRVAKVPYVLAPHETFALKPFESELRESRKLTTQVLLNHLNTGAREKILELQKLSGDVVFPETPIASLILQNANSPEQLVDVALQLRDVFAPFRRAVNQLEADLLDPNLSLKVRLKRGREIEKLARDLWGESKTDLRATAICVSDVIGEIPEVSLSPSPAKVAEVVKKLVALPIEKLVETYTKRKIRLMLKAKKDFLNSSDATARLARIFGISEGIIQRSRFRKRQFVD